MANTFTIRGGLTYVDRADFTRGAPLTAVKRMAWPSVRLHADGNALTLRSPTGSDTLAFTDTAALPHRAYLGRLPLPAAAVSFEVDGRDQVLLFWTPRPGAVLRGLAALGWDADPTP